MVNEPLDEAPKAALGVLFVHGMGESAQGATVCGFADPLVDWLTRGQLGLTSVTLTGEDLAPGEQQSAYREYSLAPAAGEPRTWRLAESWWAGSFAPASYPRMASWLIASVPWMLGEYLLNARRHERSRQTYVWFRRLRRVVIPLYALLGALLAGPLVLVLTGLLAARRVPIIGKLPRLLSNSLGDVYVILRSEQDRAAICAQIVSDHAALCARCEKTVVVAHSAGSALTHRLIQERALPGVKLFVSLGEAVWRMRWMDEISALGGRRMPAVALGVAGTVCITAAWFAFGAQERGLAIIGVVGGFVLHGISALIVWRVAANASAHRRRAIDDVAGAIDMWHDYVASSDPVPAGALTEPPHATTPAGRTPAAAAAEGVSHYRPIGVRNRRSIVLDHTAYPKNLEEFNARLALDLAAADATIELAIDGAELAIAKDARRLRTLTLALLRASSALVAAVVLAALDCQNAFDGFGAPAAVGFAIAAVALVGSWLLAGRAWRAWDTKARARFVARQPPGDQQRPIAAIALSWLASSALTAFALLCLAGAASPRACAAAAAAVAAGTVALLAVKPIGKLRDNLYA